MTAVEPTREGFQVFHPPGRGGARPQAKGERAHRAKLSDAQVAQLRADRVGGALLRELAERYGIGESQVSRIVRGRVRA